jgi:hypothetical protein
VALFHRATVTPTKAELIAAWAPSRPWAPPAGTGLDVLGSYRFDDPAGRVGLEGFLVAAGDDVLHVPLTYRDEPLDGAEHALLGRMEHSVLGTRFVYDATQDPVNVTMLAAVAMTGQGEALGLAVYDGRWYVAPTTVRLHGGGWTDERVPLDGFVPDAEGPDGLVLRNDRFDVRFHRRPKPGARPPLALAATWPGQDEGVVLAEVTDRLG